MQYTDRILNRAQGPLFFFLSLLLVEAGYLVWLRRFPAPELPWVGRIAEGGATLLLTVLGCLMAWSAFSLVAFSQSDRRTATTIDAQRSAVIQRLKAAAFWAALEGAYMSFLQFHAWCLATTFLQG
jgi:hypothetical protein